MNLLGSYKTLFFLRCTLSGEGKSSSSTFSKIGRFLVVFFFCYINLSTALCHLDVYPFIAESKFSWENFAFFEELSSLEKELF
jgi:hypothetical protein